MMRISFYSKILRRLVRHVEPNFSRRQASALFIPGSKANKTFSLLSPYLDFDERFKDLPKLSQELELRGSKIDINNLFKKWEFYKQREAEKWVLEKKREEIAREIKSLLKKETLSPAEEEERLKLTTQGKLLKQEVRAIKEVLWEMEENVIVEALKLPNVLHEKTPKSEQKILSQVGEIREPAPNEIKNHIEIGTSLGLIDYKSSLNCYLCEEAALFELATLNYAAEHFSEANMLRVAGTDFARSLVVEGCGLDHEDPSKVFILSNNEGIDRKSCNRLHLVGGASLVAFLSMHTKQLINPKHLPIKYYATGRQYTLHCEDNAQITSHGLFAVNQSSVVHTFVLVQDPESSEYTEEFEKLLNTVTSLYDSLEIHYRKVLRSANQLEPWESLRISFEIWSANLRDYIEVGHVSMCGNYISKRLLVAYQTSTGRGFPAMISGTVLSVPRLLGCLLEEDPNKFRIPTKILEYMRSYF